MSGDSVTNKIGRPTVMTPETLDTLKKAFAMSFTDEEACLYADISMSTLYDYCSKNPDFSDKKEQLKKKPNLKAKMNLLNAINSGDIDDSKWWLERKSKSEFSTKIESENKNLNRNVTLNFNRDKDAD